MKVTIVKKPILNKLNGRVGKIINVGSKVSFLPYVYITSYPLEIDYLNNSIEGSFSIGTAVKIKFKILDASQDYQNPILKEKIRAKDEG
jgi:hypothetical protein